MLNLVRIADYKRFCSRFERKQRPAISHSTWKAADTLIAAFQVNMFGYILSGSGYLKFPDQAVELLCQSGEFCGTFVDVSAA